MSRSRHFRPAQQQDVQPYTWVFSDVQVEASEDGITIDAVALQAQTLRPDVLPFASEELASAVEAIDELNAVIAPAVNGSHDPAQELSAESSDRLAFNTSYPALRDDFGAGTVGLQTQLRDLAALPASAGGSFTESGSYTATWSAGAAPAQVFDVLPGQHGFSFAGQTVPIDSPDILALDCAALGGEGAVADPYVTSGYKWGNSTYGTPGGQVTWSIAGAGLANQTGFANFFSGTTVALSSMFNFDYVAVINQAFNAWSAVANITFVQVADGGAHMGAGTTANIRICGGLVGGGASTLAWGFYPTGSAAAGDISIDTAESWTASYFLEVVMHEIGHAIGLQHSNDSTAVMYFQTNGSTTLQTDDINGIRVIYGAASSPDYTCSITSVSSSSGSAGQTITVGWSVTNSGQQGNGPQWKLYLSQDQTIAQVNEAVDINVASGNIGGTMGAGTTQTGTTTFTVPTGISGTWYLGLTVDNTNSIPESNDSNNVSSLTPFNVTTPTTGSVSIGDVTITEGDAGTKIATFTVTRSGGTAAFNAFYQTSNGTAAAGSDYVAQNGTLSFGSGVNSQTVSITINGDTIVEGDETFFVDLTGVTSGTITDSRGVGTITNDDVATGSVSISDVTITEGDAGTKTAVFTVTRTGGTAAFNVNYATADNTATAGSDYVATNGTLSFGTGINTFTFGVTINGDTTIESAESFFVNLSGATNGATITDPQGVGTISNDDQAGSVSINDVTITEGNTGTKVMTFTVTRTNGNLPFSVNYFTSNHTAGAGSDYVASTGTVSFGAGVSSQTISVTINGDFAVEADEQFVVTLTSPTNGATITDPHGVGTITNDDTAVAGSVAIGDVTITEGDAGTKLATFTVTRTGGTAAFNVDYATANNTATAGSDYVATNGTLSFAANVNTQTFTVTINGDTTIESAESFVVNLSGATNGATITDSQAVGTISNDDQAGSLSINDVTITEGNAGTKVMTFTVTRTNGNLPFNVNYFTSNHTAAAGNDYVAANGTLSFGANETSRTISVTINGDFAIESDEQFVVTLTSPTNGATITDPHGVGTISNDDTTVAGSVSINDVTITEGNAGTKVMTFTVTRSGGTAAFDVNYFTSNHTAAAGNDYVGSTGTVSFGANETSRTISVTINGDFAIESDEQFVVTLTSPTNGATITDPHGVGTITNDDTTVAGSISINDVTITEGNAGTQVMTFTVARSGGTAAFDVNYFTSNHTAAAGNDYVGSTGTVSFGANETSRTISVTINGDFFVESDEQFVVTLTSPTNGATITDPHGVGTISNDDTAVAGSISINDVTITEGDAGTKLATFTVTRTGGTAAFDVNYRTSDYTAAGNGNDYVSANGTVSFGANETSKTISVTIVGDIAAEADEIFVVTLSSPTNGGTISDPHGVGTILNDDVASAIVGALVAGGDAFYFASPQDARGNINVAEYLVSNANGAVTETGHGRFVFDQTSDQLLWDEDGVDARLLVDFTTEVNLRTDFLLH